MTPPRGMEGRGRPLPPPRIPRRGGGERLLRTPGPRGSGAGQSPPPRAHGPLGPGQTATPHPRPGPPFPAPSPPPSVPRGRARPGPPAAAVPAAAGGGRPAPAQAPPRRPLLLSHFLLGSRPPPSAAGGRSRAELPPHPTPPRRAAPLVAPPASRRRARSDWPVPLSLPGVRGCSHSPLAERTTTARLEHASRGVRSLGDGGAIQSMVPAHSAAPLPIGGWRWLAPEAASLLIGRRLCSSRQPASSRFLLVKRGCLSSTGSRSYWLQTMSIRAPPSCCLPIERETCRSAPGPAPSPVPLVGSSQKGFDLLLPFAGNPATQGGGCVSAPPSSIWHVMLKVQPHWRRALSLRHAPASLLPHWLARPPVRHDKATPPIDPPGRRST